MSYYIERYIKKHKLKNDIIIYSYWLTSSALATTFVRIKGYSFKRVARAHHIDLYEELNKEKYLTFRSVLVSELNAIYTISNHGLLHIQKQAPSRNLSISRLGTKKPAKILVPSDNNKFINVSCSYITPIKRVHIIAEALSTIQDMPIHWIHFGDGPLRSGVESKAKELLNLKSVTFEFKGATPNDELIEFYENNFVDLFINTSASEGLPVSMMEAQSFGIPIVALNVGGVSEIVVDDFTGKLLPSAATSSKIGIATRSLLSTPKKERDLLRLNALNFWNTNYNAETNYTSFLISMTVNRHV
jgi:glycosyltransferase involved in cell wall biosynthesis